MRHLRDLAYILVGNAIYAAATVLFVIPLDLITCGSTGIALFVNRLTGFSISGFTYLFYGASFALGALLLGKRFALTALVSSLWYPLAFSLFSRMLEGVTVTGDPLLATLYAGLMIGIGIGAVLRVGASTGGTDVLPLLAKKHLGLPLAVGIWGLDVAILAMQMTVAEAEDILYGLLMVVLYSFLIDRVLLFGNGSVQVTVISREPNRIAEMILDEIDRGLTFLHGRTGYHGRECEVLLTVVSGRELAKLERLTARLDPDAFLIVHSIREVRGLGFAPIAPSKKAPPRIKGSGGTAPSGGEST